VTFERFASLADEHVGAIRCSVTAEGYAPGEHARTQTADLDLDLWASFNMAVGNDGLMHWHPVDQNHEDGLLWLHAQTVHSHVQLAQTMSFTTEAAGLCKEFINSDTAPGLRIRGKLALGQTITAEKVVVMHTSHDVADPLQAALMHHRKILEGSAFLDHLNGHHPQAPERATHASSNGHVTAYTALLRQHQGAWRRYWHVSDIIIEGDERAQQGIRYNLYQLRINTSPTKSYYSIAAKGLTGFGYRGHIFHDTEIFMLPYFTYVHPENARNLLLYRYHLLPAARAKAARNGYRGAQFPWESTLDGEEATPVYLVNPETGEVIPIPNGFIELHITASIAYAVWHYWFVTGDDEFMRDYGAELILSTAEFWASRAEWHPQRHAYEINGVVGPDEWHEYVNNNAYTNYMACWNIQQAMDILSWLQTTAPHKAEELTHRLDVTDPRLAHWQDVVSHLRIPRDMRTGLFEQFDGFFQREQLDQGKYEGRTASYQALLGLKEMQKYRIIKQADVLMFVTLLRQQFDLQTKQVNWDYYHPITDHEYGSSLTPAFHAILACELDYVDAAYELFMTGALVDLENLRGNTAEGIHTACCGAVWQAVVLGFAGLQLTDKSYTTNPSWPAGWRRLAFTFMHKGQPVFVDLRRGE
jgi:kojibiose phosphorylase